MEGTSEQLWSNREINFPARVYQHRVQSRCRCFFLARQLRCDLMTMGRYCRRPFVHRYVLDFVILFASLSGHGRKRGDR